MGGVLLAEVCGIAEGLYVTANLFQTNPERFVTDDITVIVGIFR